MNISIEFSIKEFVWALSLILMKQFRLFEPNLPKKGNTGLKLKERTSSLSSAHLN